MFKCYIREKKRTVQWVRFSHGALTTVSGTTTFNDILQPDVLKIFMSTFIHLLESSRVRVLVEMSESKRNHSAKDDGREEHVRNRNTSIFLFLFFDK